MSYAERHTRFCVRHGRALWLLTLLLLLPAARRSWQLYAHMNSSLERLLPRDAASVVALDEARRRLHALHYLGVVVDAGSPANLPAAERFTSELAARLRRHPDRLIESVRVGAADEQAFLERHAALYVALADLIELRERVHERHAYEVLARTGLSLLDDEPPAALDFSELERKYHVEARGDASQARFTDRREATTVLLIRSNAADLGAAQTLVRRVHAEIAALGGPDHYARGLRYGLGGDLATSVEETQALRADLAFSSVCVVLAVLAALLLYFRWPYGVLVLVLPLAAGTLLAFALASLPPFSVSELNANTAFLGSIIVGNGINFGIVLLARYLEERRRGCEVDAALVLAVRGSWRGTSVAALAAAVSYAALGITRFAGFRQFGCVGALGMLCAWAAAYVLSPALLSWLDRGARAPKPLRRRWAATTRLSQAISQLASPIALSALLLTLSAAVAVRSLDRHQLEHDFSKLRRRSTMQDGEGYWGARMDRALGQYLTPIVLLADDPASAERLANALRVAAQQAPLRAFVGAVRSLDDVVPTDQSSKLHELMAIRSELTPLLRSQLRPEDDARITELLHVTQRGPVTTADVPSAFLTGLREQDGSLGRTVLVYPRLSEQLWQGPALHVFVSSLRELAASHRAAARPARVAGALPLSSDLLDCIARDGPLASLLAFCAVALVVLAAFRGRGAAWLIVASLCAGVLWMTAATLWLGLKINFANFIAFPITFGVGVDYAVNVINRYEQEPGRDIARALRGVGGAVALCSLTTIIGYSSLLLAQNRALFLFGLFAVLGELACMCAALIALPSALVLWNRLHEAREAAPTAQRSRS